MSNFLRSHGFGGGIKPEGTAVANDVRDGETFINESGEVLTGNVPVQTTQSVTPSNTNQTLSAGIYDGDITVTAVTFDASKVLSDTTIAGTTGTMPNNGSLGTITPGTTAKSIPAGYTSGGSVAGDGNLASGNIRAGVNLFGVGGKSTVVDVADTSPNLQPNVLNGKYFYNELGQRVEGDMPNRGGETITPTTSTQTRASGYYSGITVNPIPGKYKEYAGGIGTSNSNELTFRTWEGSQYTYDYVEITGLTFAPDIVILYYPDTSTSYGFATIYDRDAIFASAYRNAEVEVWDSNGANWITIQGKLSGDAGYVNSNGFLLPMAYSGDSVWWRAIKL